MKTSGRTFSDEKIDIDGRDFENCKFVRCTLVYSGGKPPSLVGLELVDTVLGFTGPAGNTLSLIKAMATPNSGFQELILATLPEVFHLKVEKR